MSRKVCAQIHLDAVVHNYRLARAQAPGAHAVAIVKADAYGHGAVPVAQALAAEADAFGVACIEEAMALRAAGLGAPIVLLEGFFDADELPIIAREGFWPAVHSLHQLEALEQAQLATPVPVWLKIDTGMHRLGVQPQEVATSVARLQACNAVADVVLMTHFACSDEPDKTMTLDQLACFDQAAGTLGLAASLSNSAAVMAWPRAHRQWLRPGIMLYGATPFEQPNPIADQLQAAMTLSSEVIAVREVPACETVGYGATFRCDRPRRIGTVAMGYADGYPRHARNGTPVVVAGQRAQLAGRVSMDMITVDLTDLPHAGVGSSVELWGRQLPVAEVARWSDTIPYTLLSGLTPRVPRRYD
ncbi:alanine racemase [Marinobacterium weihaiense]|uniref:Alanine racemase n=1 Tax=Marinobacterium weihaiense TaxID=2851016 RepID=A0ABS6M9G8_9GAMM|nr:alanine racemase [Marinobacterium weihaiense]MBV0932941.1 alanine racemase [Marinobacterium weihaiense]